jgi:hypothetical protein
LESSPLQEINGTTNEGKLNIVHPVASFFIATHGQATTTVFGLQDRQKCDLSAFSDNVLDFFIDPI